MTTGSNYNGLKNSNAKCINKALMKVRDIIKLVEADGGRILLLFMVVIANINILSNQEELRLQAARTTISLQAH